MYYTSGGRMPPYMKNGKRDYAREYDKYHSSKKQKQNRAKRNAARAKLAKAGTVKKGDGKDVAHKKSLHSGGSNSRSNLTVQSRSKNRSHSINKQGKKK